MIHNHSKVSDSDLKQCQEYKANLEMQEVIGLAPPQPLPRRRLASFGGLSCPESSSPFTGMRAYNQNKDGNLPGTTGNLPDQLGYSQGNPGSTQSLRESPQSSGRSTPVTGLGSWQLQHVRDQMVAALQKLKELEEQVKVIPVLESKVVKLKDENMQLLLKLKKHSDEDMNDIWEKVCSEKKLDTATKNDKEAAQKEYNHLKEYNKLSGEVEKTISAEYLPIWPRTTNSKSTKSVATNTDKDRNPLCCEHKCQSVQLKIRSTGNEADDDNFGMNKNRDEELFAQQEIIYLLKEKIMSLEAELKESTLQKEMNLLKFELLAAAGERSVKKIDRSCSATPSAVNASAEAKPSTKCQGVGNHVAFCDASTGEVTEMKNVEVSCCSMLLHNVRSGPDVEWVVRERVDTADKNMGVHIATKSQGVGTCLKLCDTGSNTENLLTAVCDGDINVNLSEDEGTASELTNSVRNLVSRFTNTRQAINTDSITNTVIKSQDKHTNTPQEVKRTVSVGSSAQDLQARPQTRTIGVGTSHSADSYALQPHSKVTRDASVGFININDNFLVGVKTRNMASGPSRLPDPLKTRSIGVGEGRVWQTQVKESASVLSKQPLQENELNYYIEEMQKFLTEHKDLLAEEGAEKNINQHKNSQRNASPTQICRNPQEQNAGLVLDASESADTETLVMCPDDDTCTGAKPNDVKRMIQMLEQQTQQDKSAKDINQWSVRKKKNIDQNCSNSRKNMRLMGVTTGLEPISPDSTSVTATTVEKPRKNTAVNIRKNNEEAKGEKHFKTFSRKRSKASVKVDERFKFSERIISACHALKMHLSDDTAEKHQEIKESLHTIKQEWFSISSQKSAAPSVVKDYLSAFHDVSPSVQHHVINMTDSNGNTALHYCVSYSNFNIVKTLLSTDACDVNLQNKAGYTPVMLAALAAVSSPEHMVVVNELFSKGDVNIKASQAGQTALMLAVSHGSMEMVQALLGQGAEVNLQDDEGSTALMCASEHGHRDIVKLLLQQPGCDASLTDSDESTALSIALEAGYKEIAMLLYAHANFSKGKAGAAGCPKSPSSPSRNKCI